MCVDNYRLDYENSDLHEQNCQDYYIVITPLFKYEGIEKEVQSFGYCEIKDYVCLGKLQQAHEWIKNKNLQNRFSGYYKTWKEAESAIKKINGGKGYAEEDISNAVLRATQRIRKGSAAYERDSVLFYKQEWNAQLLAALYYITQSIGKFRFDLLDFGGALGSTFFQHQLLLKNINWNIIEQKGFVDIGRKEIPEISFFYDVQEYIDTGKACDVLYISSVLMYVSDPYDCLETLLKKKFKYVIIDRTYYNNNLDSDRLCLQRVSDGIYPAMYPSWLISRKKPMSCLRIMDINL